MKKAYDFDPAEFIEDKDDEKAALIAAFKEDPGDGSLISSTLEDIAKARGMSQLAKESGVGLASLYQALSKSGKSEFKTVIKVSRSLGISLMPQINHRSINN